MASKKKSDNNETVARGEQPIAEELTGFVQQEEVVKTPVPEQPPEQPQEKRIMATKAGVKLYSRASLSSDAVIGTMPVNMAFAVKGTVSNPFGEFYRLADGRFVSKGDTVKEI